MASFPGGPAQARYRRLGFEPGVGAPTFPRGDVRCNAPRPGWATNWLWCRRADICAATRRPKRTMGARGDARSVEVAAWRTALIGETGLRVNARQ